MKEMSKFPTREPSNLVFGRSKLSTRQRREIKDAKSELNWFEEKNIQKKKKKKKKKNAAAAAAQAREVAALGGYAAEA